MIRSVAGLEAITILPLVTGGLTITSLTAGAQSVPYYATALLAGLVATTSILRRKLSRLLLPGIFGIFFILTIFSLQGLFLPSIGIGFNLAQSSLRAGAIVVILIISVALANMHSSVLDPAILCSWAILFSILIYGIIAGGALRIELGVDRFSGAGFREVIWAENALGTLVLAFLTKKPTVVIITVPVTAVIILATQMRTVGIAALVSTFLYSTQYLYYQRGKIGRAAFLTFSTLAALSIVFFLDSITSLVWTLLLLDDPHRGIESGFSGRFENSAAGWAAYLDSPFIGFGVADEVVNYTHNGYFLILSQYGFFGLFWCYLILNSLLSAIRRRDIVLCSCIVSLVFYYIGQPRHINFQIFPFVGVLSVFFALAAPHRQSSVKHQINKWPNRKT